MSKRRLGKGIDALLGDPESDEEIQASITDVALDKIESDPGQPRKSFSDESLEELASSIRSRGVIQPIILEERDQGNYRIVAGERRFRAAKLAGLSTVPAIVRPFSEDEKYEIALIENIQREDLNPIEEANGYHTIMDRYGLTQDEIAHRLGKKRSTVANSLRLLKLSNEMQAALIDGRISAGHARALLSVGDSEHRATLFRYCLEERASVREAERAAGSLNQVGSIVSETVDWSDSASAVAASANEGEATERQPPNAGNGPALPGAQNKPRKTPELLAAEERLIEALGTKVVINGGENRGRIEIAYYSLDDLNRILDLLG